MEEHPIPQNVTQFEFHLVGDMTLKQFGYLAAGLALGYLTYMLLSKPFPFVAYPLIVVFVIAGVALAFLPISERPLDHWLKAYLAAIFSPTQMTFQSKEMKVDDPNYDRRLALYLDTAPEPTVSVPKTSPKLAAMSQMAPTTQQVVPALPETPPVSPPPPQPVPKVVVPSMPAPTQQPVQPSPVTPPPAPIQAAPPPAATPLPKISVNPTPPTPPQAAPPPAAQPSAPTPQPMVPMPESAKESDDDLTKMVEYAKEAQIVQTEIIEAEKQVEQIKSQAAQPGNTAEQFGAEFQKVMANLNKLNMQAQAISKELAKVSDAKSPSPDDPSVQIVNVETKPTEKFVSLTQTPNIINGIVTDSQGAYLEGTIVVVHDKDDIPVRALKSNKLGQFLAATPLPNGTYTMTLEKDNLNFDVLRVELDGSVLPPVKIAAKKGV